jgi:hypothetical protein
VVIDNPAPTTSSGSPAQPPTSTPSSPSPSPSPSVSPTPPARPAAPSPNPSAKPTPKPTPTPTPTPGKPACGTFTADQIAWAAHEIGVSQGALKSALKAHPAAVCCLPHPTKECHPDKAELAKLAKQVAALAHQAAHDKSTAADKDKGKSTSDDKGKGADSADHGKRHDTGHDNGHDTGHSNGHSKPGCGRAR